MRLDEVDACLERRRLGTWILRGCLGLAALTVVAMDVVRATTSPRVGPPEPLLLAFLVCLVLAGLARAARFSEFKPFAPPSTVEVDDEAIAFTTRGDSGWVPLAEIEEIHHGHVGYLGFRRENGDVLHVRVAARRKLMELLDAVEAGGARRAMRVTLGDTRFPRWVGGMLGLPAGVGLTWFSSHLPTAIVNVGVFAAAWYGVYLGLRALLGPDTVIIGDDGVTVRKVFSSRFIPLDRLGRVDVQSSRVRLRETGGRTITAAARGLHDEHRLLLDDRIDAARSAAKSATYTPEIPELDRRGRSIAEWRGALVGLLGSESAYRRAPVTAEDLMTLLDNPAAAAERRLGAAIALAAANAPGARRRVRLAAYASANTPMRIALKQLAEGRGGDAAIETALAVPGR